MEDEYVMYLIVRSDLKMTKGKIAAQCCHAVQWLTINNINKPSFQEYINSCHPKICLKVPSEDIMNSIVSYCYKRRTSYYQVVDVGRTQVPPNTKTVLGVGPVKRSKVPYIIKNLNLV